MPDEAAPEGYHRYVHCAEKAGYSGVALYTRQQPDAVHIGVARRLSVNRKTYCGIPISAMISICFR